MSPEAHASRPAPGALRALAADRRGVALAEYALLLGLFLAVLTGVLMGMRSHLQSLFSKANTELQSGDCATGGNCSVASSSSSSGGSSGGSAGGTSGGTSGSSGGTSGSNGGTSGSGTPGSSAGNSGGGTTTSPDPAAADQSGGSSGQGSGISEPPPTLDIHPH